MEQHHQLALADGPLMDNAEQYRRLMGRLIYLVVTRLDLAYSIHILSQFMLATHISTLGGRPASGAVFEKKI